MANFSIITLGAAGHDAAVRTRRASSQLRSQGGRGAAQSRLRLCHEGARQPEARLGRILFLPPARSRRHPHRLEARRRDHRHGAAARRHRGHAHHAGGDRSAVRAGDRQAGRRPDQDPPARPRLEEGRAGGELPQAPRRHLQRHPRPAREARRPRAQHAHARAHEAGDAQAHLRGNARHLCPARRAHGHGEDARGAGGPRVPLAASRRLRHGDGQAHRAAQVERGPGRGNPRRAGRQAGRGRHRRGGLGPREEGLCHLAQDGQQADQPRAAFRHLRLPRHRQVDRRLLPRARRRPHDVAHGARAASRTTSRRRSRTTTSRSTPPSSARATSASSCRSARA